MATRITVRPPSAAAGLHTCTDCGSPTVLTGCVAPDCPGVHCETCGTGCDRGVDGGNCEQVITASDELSDAEALGSRLDDLLPVDPFDVNAFLGEAGARRAS